ncbi:MAG TPA: carbamate kinase [Candidatus Nanoarchaeia archaeon]|nr:carbamate kinase [Candidatus Nanoarchaeia archaeon]
MQARRGDMRTVIALGGNALTRPEERGTYQELQHNILNTCKSIQSILQHEVVIVSGSGPQIGNILLQNELAKGNVPSMPLHVLDAELEGELGYMIQQGVKNVTRKPVITVITQVLVDRHDPAFRKPTKFVGRFFSKQQAKEISRTHKYMMREDAGRGYRRVVASPQPIKIIEKDAIHALLQKKFVVIAVGGGGIPVTKKHQHLHGRDAVIDKDLAAACLAKGIKADQLIILTGVDAVYRDFATKRKKRLARLTAKQAEQLLKQGQFPPGNMGPKIQASLQFLKAKGKKVVITSPEKLKKAMQGKAGTVITP